MSQVNEPAGSAQYVHIESEKNTILQNHGRRPWYVYSSSIWPKYDLIRVQGMERMEFPFQRPS